MNLRIDLSCNDVMMTGTKNNQASYYKSNVGTIIGAGAAATAFGLKISPAFQDVDSTIKKIKNRLVKFGIEENIIDKRLADKRELFERQKKMAWPSALVAVVYLLGSGILYDRIRNNNAKIAQEAAKTGNGSTSLPGGDMVTLNNGKQYYKSDNGWKFGALTGAACGIIHGFMKMIFNKGYKPGTFAPTMLYILGGVTAATASQQLANISAKKQAQNM